MNAAVVMETCPNEELLAAFIDGRLDEQSRKQVIAHLADCAECRDVVVTANEYESSAEMKTAQGGEVVPGRFGRPRVLAPLIAAAAVIAVVFGVPAIRERVLPKSEMEEIVEAGNALPKRAIAARLSGNFAYKQHTDWRNASEREKDIAETLVDIAADQADQRATAHPTAENLHAAGVGNVLAKNRGKAVTDLEQAAQANPSSAEIQNDLAAAYIARGDKQDYARALAAAERSWTIKQTHAAAWNIALALDYGQRDAEAVVAWKNYLALDPSSPWANEARAKLKSAQEMLDLQKK